MYSDHVYDRLAMRAVDRAEQTGPLSKILSHVGILLFVLILAHTLSNGEWPAMVLIVLGVVPLRFIPELAWGGAFAYLVWAGDYLGVTILASLAASCIASRLSGFLNAKREITEGRSGISPFEGMSSGLSLIIQVISLPAAYFSTGIVSIVLWLTFAGSLFYSTVRYSYRLFPKWARLHYPLMRRWSRHAARLAACKLSGGVPDISAELYEFVKSVYPHFGLENAKQIVDAAENDRQQFTDFQLMKNFYFAKNPSVDASKLEAFTSELANSVKKSDDISLRLAYVIASVVENDFGLDERVSYLDAALFGKAT